MNSNNQSNDLNLEEIQIDFDTLDLPDLPPELLEDIPDFKIDESTENEEENIGLTDNELENILEIPEQEVESEDNRTSKKHYQ
ncbi:MAG: hypothetical protein KatS3mg129_2810 [Leptospiraceae bacterium]|nr:MAG: hypothetical protein KatS3mg129_2810 [Leptospiraceae bacterium]